MKYYDDFIKPAFDKDGNELHVGYIVACEEDGFWSELRKHDTTYLLGTITAYDPSDLTVSIDIMYDNIIDSTWIYANKCHIASEEEIILWKLEN